MKKLLVSGLVLVLTGCTALEKTDVTVGGYLESKNHSIKQNSSVPAAYEFRVKPDFPVFL